MLGTKQFTAARDAVVAAAGDTRQVVTVLAAVAVTALVLAVAAVVLALKGRRPAHV